MSALALPNFQAWRIHTVRGQKVILDSDLASFFKVPINNLNQAVRRNHSTLSTKVAFRLTTSEWTSLRSQTVILEKKGRGQHRKTPPVVYTRQGVALASAHIWSSRAADAKIVLLIRALEGLNPVPKSQGILPGIRKTG